MMFLVGADLFSSFNQPQFASRLELYETDLRLHMTAWRGEDLPDSLQQQVKQALQDEQPLNVALKSYQKVRDRAGKTFSDELSQIAALRAKPVTDETNVQIETLQATVQKQEKAIDELDLRIGILQAEQGNISQAQQTWQPMLEKTNQVGQTAKALDGLWRSQPVGNVAVLKQGLDGWFRYQALQQQYEVAQQPEQLAQLEVREQAVARSAMLKLSATGTISILSLGIGIGLLVTVVVQQLLKGSAGWMAGLDQVQWQVPWDWEVIWQVLIVGFFFMGQVLLPITLQGLQGALGVSSANLGERSRALWILISYLGLAGGGLAVLYGSIKPNLPLAENWFNVDGKGAWVKWGVGGYFVAFPLVVGVSLLNSLIWQGKGGSNPILSIAAQNQDPGTLLLIFVTAAIAAPFYEETLFRGFLLPSLTRYMSTWQAILLSSFLFAIVHLSLSEVLPLMALAIVLGVVYTRTQNLLASMLLHCLWNSGTLIALFLVGGSS
jgi:hypothetical protein